MIRPADFSRCFQIRSGIFQQAPADATDHPWLSASVSGVLEYGHGRRLQCRHGRHHRKHACAGRHELHPAIAPEDPWRCRSSSCNGAAVCRNPPERRPARPGADRYRRQPRPVSQPCDSHNSGRSRWKVWPQASCMRPESFSSFPDLPGHLGTCSCFHHRDVTGAWALPVSLPMTSRSILLAIILHGLSVTLVPGSTIGFKTAHDAADLARRTVRIAPAFDSGCHAVFLQYFQRTMIRIFEYPAIVRVGMRRSQGKKMPCRPCHDVRPGKREKNKYERGDHRVFFLQNGHVPSPELHAFRLRLPHFPSNPVPRHGNHIMHHAPDVPFLPPSG